MKKYGFYTRRHIVDKEFTLNESLNGFYDLSFFLSYPQYRIPTLSIKDGDLISRCGDMFFFEALYDETVIDEYTILEYIRQIPQEFNLQLFPNIFEAKQWLRNNTQLKEITPGIFEIRGESNMMGIYVPQVLLTIE